MSAKIEELRQRVDMIAARMSLREPFISAMFPQAERLFFEGDERITAFTNGKCVGFGVEFCEKQTNAQLLGLALHEAMHIILMHPWRMKGLLHRDIANDAQDAIINITLKNLGYELPDGGVFIRWVTDDMSFESVYDRLLKEAAKKVQIGSGKGGTSGDGGGGTGGDDDNTDGDKKPEEFGGTGGGGWDGQGDIVEAPSDADTTDVEATIMTAARMAKTCGMKGALLDRILGGELQPSVPWFDILRYKMTALNRDDYSHVRFNKRIYTTVGLMLPTLYSYAMGGILIGVDTSASMSQEELDQCAAELRAIFVDCRPAFVEVVYCDTDVKQVQRFESHDTLTLDAKGGGGTRFKPVFDHLAGMSERVEALIYMSDLDGNVDECQQPPVPVIWACTNRYNDSKVVPFGDVIPVVV